MNRFAIVGNLVFGQGLSTAYDNVAIPIGFSQIASRQDLRIGYCWLIKKPLAEGRWSGIK